MSRSWPRSSTEAGWAVALAGLLLSASALTPARADAATSFTEQARQVLAEGGYQLELPHAEAPPDGRTSLATGPAGPSGGPPPNPAPAAPPEGPVAPPPNPALAAQSRFLGLLLGGAALVVLILVVLALLAGWRSRHQGQQGFALGPAESTVGAAESAAAEPSAPRGDADRLAAEGRWVEALQALLHGVQQRLAERHRRTIPASRTSREVFRELPVSGAAREAQGELVALVERALFGGAVVGAQDYGRGLELARGALGSGGRP